MTLVVFLFLLATGCTKRNPAVCCTDAADCEMQGLAEQSLCEKGLSCVNNECVELTSCRTDADCGATMPRCDTGTAECVACLTSTDCTDGICDATTHVCGPCSSDEECPSGYCSLTTQRCEGGSVTPLYVPDACNGEAAGPLSVGTLRAINTTEPVRCYAGVVQQTGAPEICVQRFTTIDVAAGGQLLFHGTRAVALVADGDVSIAGILNVSNAGAGTAISGTYPNTAAGGGGAGFRNSGGNGGGGVTNGGDISPPNGALIGGPSAAPIPGVISAGTGGGAITLVSCRGRISITGQVLAGGGAGQGSPYASGLGGQGGGAGGQVLLQGREITVESAAVVVANGGGGATGLPCSGFGSAGVSGNTVACGGQPGVNSAGGGGAGGCLFSGPATGGTAGSCSGGGSATHGGGGGSAGYLRAAMPVGRSPVIESTTISPAFESTETIGTH